jgi:uncharacterized integral membrane protein
VAAQSALVRDFDTAQDQAAPRFQRMEVEPIADSIPHQGSSVAAGERIFDGGKIRPERARATAPPQWDLRVDKAADESQAFPFEEPAMPAFVKTPRFIVGTILVLWVAYVIYANFQLDPVRFYLLPFHVLELQLRLSAVLIGAAIFGAIVTFVVQWLWRRSKNGSAPAVVSSRTIP